MRALKAKRLRMKFSESARGSHEPGLRSWVTFLALLELIRIKTAHGVQREALGRSKFDGWCDREPSRGRELRL